MFLASPGVFTVVAWRRRRFRLDVFFVRIWLLNAFRRRTFPVPVTEKRFFAPLWVFIFGTVPARLFRRENHGHRLAFEFRLALDLGDVGELLGDAIDDLAAELRVRDLPPAEHQRHLHLVAFLEEPPGVTRLRVEVVIIDARSVLHLFQVNDVLLLLRDARHLRLLELELAVVHDADHRRARGRCYFDEIETLFLRCRESSLDVQDAHLTSVGCDDAQRADADLPVDANSLCRILNSRTPRRGKTKTRTPKSASARIAPSMDGGRRCSRSTPVAHLAGARARG